VTHRDPERLKSVCEELRTGAMNVNAGEASKAAVTLSYVDDPIAVPYLGRVLKESFAGKDAAISGLARIGNPEAVQILTSYSQTADPEMKLQVENALQEARSRVKK
jgi:HEAT repeat protein